jgi:hypothetical protein
MHVSPDKFASLKLLQVFENESFVQSSHTLCYIIQAPKSIHQNMQKQCDADE